MKNVTKEKKNKTILVTGHNGFIGTILTKLLLVKGYPVVGYDCNYFDQDCNFYDYNNTFKEIIKDIRQIEETDVEEIYAICHLAALSNDPIGEFRPELTYDINNKSSVKLAQIAKNVGVKKFINSSSCSLYGLACGDSPLTEEAKLEPITAYAKLKVYSERDIFPLGDDEFSITFLRNATAYGVSPKLRLDLVVNNLIGWAVTTSEIKILSDGTPWRPIVHAEDIARAFITVIESPTHLVNKQAFNVGSDDENYQIKDIVHVIREVIPNCKITITGERGLDTRTYRVNFDKINHLLGFKTNWNLKKVSIIFTMPIKNINWIMTSLMEDILSDKNN